MWWTVAVRLTCASTLYFGHISLMWSPNDLKLCASLLQHMPDFSAKFHHFLEFIWYPKQLKQCSFTVSANHSADFMLSSANHPAEWYRIVVKLHGHLLLRIRMPCCFQIMNFEPMFFSNIVLQVWIKTVSSNFNCLQMASIFSESLESASKGLKQVWVWDSLPLCFVRGLTKFGSNLDFGQRWP